jgi:hypothetical protein
MARPIRVSIAVKSGRGNKYAAQNVQLKIVNPKNSASGCSNNCNIVLPALRDDRDATL